MRVEGITHVGLLRKTNEDRYMIYNKENLKFFIVADGMGGYNSGELASSMAVEKISRSLISNVKPKSDIQTIEKILVDSVIEANKTIFLEANENPEHAGMGTTFLISILLGNELLIGNIGDSRAYIVSDGNITQVTEDDSYINEIVKQGAMSKEDAEKSPYRRYITKSLGNSLKANISLYRSKIKRGDTVLMCSDGLTSMIDDENIRDIILGNDIHDAIKKLLDAALDNGGKDNISIILFNI